MEDYGDEDILEQEYRDGLEEYWREHADDWKYDEE